jgi:hypothetical protein
MNVESVEVMAQMNIVGIALWCVMQLNVQILQKIIHHGIQIVMVS